MVDSESEGSGGGRRTWGSHSPSPRGNLLPTDVEPISHMHRQSMASRSQFGQSSAQTASAQALRNKKKEYEAISALEQSCAELIATLEDMATDLNTTAEATTGTIHTSELSLNDTRRVVVAR